MAVTDFGARRFADSEPRRARNYPYQHQAQDDYDEEYGWYDEGQGDPMDQPSGPARAKSRMLLPIPNAIPFAKTKPR